MIYLQRNNRSRSRKTIISVGIIVGIVAVIGLVQWLFGSNLSIGTIEAGTSVSKPFFVFGKQISFATSFISSRKTLIEQNQALRDEIDGLKIKLLSFDSLAKEHEEILKTYNRSNIENKVLASVMVKPPQTPYDTLILDVGSENQASINNRVYGIGGIVLGIIDEIGKKTSRAVLFSNPDRETRVIVERTDQNITLIGKGGGNFEAEVPQEVDVLKSDTLVLAGIRLPIVAIVVDVESNPASAFKKVIARVPLNIFNLRFVEVETSPGL